jgi:hypothetical protein
MRGGTGVALVAGMKSLLAAALVAVLATAGACTHHHKLPAGSTAPASEVSHGRGALEGAGIGVLGGALAGAVVGYAAGDDPECSNDAFLCLQFKAEDKALFGGLYVGAIGLAAGALIGGVIGSRDVYEVTPGYVPRVSTVVAPDQVGAKLDWSF